MTIMFFYYGYRMFVLTPWYDELYTYYFFISRGPVYAAIHWPLPNNHVGYSVLSGFLDLFGNAAIGLRGISFCCALANLWLIYVIGRRHLKPGWSLGAVLLYLSMGLVNQLAVQGRGYTLAATCYLTALLMMDLICREDEVKKRYYIIFALALTLGLYTLPSSVYWVLPLCLAGGIYLLYGALKDESGQDGINIDYGDTERNKSKENNRSRSDRSSSNRSSSDRSRSNRSSSNRSSSDRSSSDTGRSNKWSVLFKLIISAFSAAVMTVGLYTTIWLAIGSNLLSDEAQSGFSGQSHLRIIFSVPFQAIKRGITYMLATPYIQSVEGGNFPAMLFDWYRQLFGYMQSGFSVVILIVLLAGCVILAVDWLGKSDKREFFFGLYLFTGILVTPVMLLIQHALPYYRVFSFMGVLIGFLVIWLLQKLFIWMTGKFQRKCDMMRKWQHGDAVGTVAGTAVVAVIAILAMIRIFSADYMIPYGMREHIMQDALEHSDFMNARIPCVTDCTQQYLIKYLYGVECENQGIGGSDFLLLDKKMADPEYDVFEWEFYHTYDTIPWDYVENSMIKVYENDRFMVYEKIAGIK